MEARKFNTVNELSNTAVENKTAEYVNMANRFAEEAVKLADNTDQFYVRMAAKECRSASDKAAAADCEYAAYVAANEAEKWLEKIIERV